MKYHIFVRKKYKKEKNMTLFRFLSQLFNELFIEKVQVTDDEYYSDYYKAYLEE